MKFIDKVLDHFAETTVEEIIEDNEESDYMLAIDYLVRTFPEKINSAAEAEGVRPTAIASNILDYINEADYKLKYKDIMQEDNYDLIRSYVIKYFIRQRSIKQREENSIVNKVNKALTDFGNKKVTLFKLKNGHKIKWQINKAARAIGITMLAATLAFAATKYGRRAAITKENDEVSQYLAVLANPGSDDPLRRGESITEQNEYYNSHFQNYNYDEGNMAQDILDVCLESPELFDLCMYDVYVRIQNNRLLVMDRVLNSLKKQMAKDDRYRELLPKLEQCDTFLEYLVYNDLIKGDNNTYVALNEYILKRDIHKVSASSYADINEAMKSYRTVNREKLHAVYKQHIKAQESEEKAKGK